MVSGFAPGARWLSVCFLSAMACGDDASAIPDGATPLLCEPADSRECDCPFGGPGYQDCASEGTQWTECHCPVESYELREGVREIDLPPSREWSLSASTLEIPAAGHDDLLTIPPNTLLLSFEGSGFVGRLVRADRMGDRIRVEYVPIDNFDQVFAELSMSLDQEINVFAGLPPEVETRCRWRRSAPESVSVPSPPASPPTRRWRSTSPRSPASISGRPSTSPAGRRHRAA